MASEVDFGMLSTDSFPFDLSTEEPFEYIEILDLMDGHALNAGGVMLIFLGSLGSMLWCKVMCNKRERNQENLATGVDIPDDQFSVESDDFAMNRRLKKERERRMRLKRIPTETNDIHSFDCDEKSEGSTLSISSEEALDTNSVILTFVPTNSNSPDSMGPPLPHD